MRKGYFVTGRQLMGVLGAIILSLGAVPLMAATGADGIALTGTETTGGSPVSEPAIMLFIGFGLIGLAGYVRKKFFRVKT